MCGICGAISLPDRTGGAQPDLKRLIPAMNHAIVHRGPDGDGYYYDSGFAATADDMPGFGMAMRRLSIIDVAGSNQPLYNEDRSIAMVFNGEIYNYRELQTHVRARGHQLTTHGDGETLIHLYEEYGLDFFSHLRGMYAIALWDSRKKTLVLAVDHIGMKPLYLTQHGGTLRFASEVKALLADSSLPREINLDVLDTYLSFGYMIGQETLFKGITRLPPGHALVISHAGQSLRRHWKFGSPEGQPIADEATAIQTVRDQFLESVRLHLESDVPLGLFLSGGIDSAATLAAMVKYSGDRVRTYTIGYAMTTPDNELEQARRVSGHFGTAHHEYVISAEDWWKGFEQYVYYHDEPNANPSAVSLMLLAKETVRDVKVVLTGLGGDELFGGYRGHRVIPQILQNYAHWGRWLSPLRHPFGMIERWYPAMKRLRYIGAIPYYLPPVRHALFPPELGLMRSQSFDGMVWSDALRQSVYGSELMAHWRSAQHKERTYSAIVRDSWRDDPYNTAQALVINTWLTGNALLSQDKVTMAHSLESRVPFFDPALLDTASRIAPSIRMKANKHVLREAVRPLLPESAVERPKQPFGTPIQGWFDSDLRTRLRDVLDDPGAISRRLFDRSALDRLIAGHFDRRARQEEIIFRLVTLELWAKRFMGSTFSTEAVQERQAP